MITAYSTPAIPPPQQDTKPARTFANEEALATAMMEDAKEIRKRCREITHYQCISGAGMQGDRRDLLAELIEAMRKDPNQGRKFYADALGVSAQAVSNQISRAQHHGYVFNRERDSSRNVCLYLYTIAQEPES